MKEEAEAPLGWFGIDQADQRVIELRQTLREQQGIEGLVLFEPNDLVGIRSAFLRDGFAMVQNMLDPDAVARLHAGCLRVIREILERDPLARGNRGSHRYSFGSVSRTGAQLHQAEWVELLQLPALNLIIEHIFGGPDFIVRSGGGDFCLPGAIDYQPLHSDMSDQRQIQLGSNKTLLIGSFSDPSQKMTYRDLPCPYISCNFLTTGWHAENGPIRQIPGTQNSRAPMPDLENEPAWMKASRVYPAPAGSVILRDVRAWHGGTPNVSEEVRAIPNVEFFAPWYREPFVKSLPRALFHTLPSDVQSRCRFIVEDVDVPLRLGYRKSLGGTPENSRSRPSKNV